MPGIAPKYSKEAKDALVRSVRDEGLPYTHALNQVLEVHGEQIPYETARKIVQQARNSDAVRAAKAKDETSPVRSMAERLLKLVDRELKALEKSQAGQADLDAMGKLTANLERLDKLVKTNLRNAEDSGIDPESEVARLARLIED